MNYLHYSLGSIKSIYNTKQRSYFQLLAHHQLAGMEKWAVCINFPTAVIYGSVCLDQLNAQQVSVM